MLSFSEIILHLLGSCERSSPASCVGHFSVVMKRKSSGTAVGLKMDNISGVERKEEENNSPQPMQIVNELPRRVFSAIISESDWTTLNHALHAITKAHIQWKLRRKCDEARWKRGKVVKAFRYRRMFPDPIMEVEEKLPLCLHNLEERRPSDRILKERESSHILIGS